MIRKVLQLETVNTVEIEKVLAHSGLKGNDKADEMRMNLVAADFEAVEELRSKINAAGLEAIMESSNAQGDKVRARLRIGERS